VIRKVRVTNSLAKGIENKRYGASKRIVYAVENLSLDVILDLGCLHRYGAHATQFEQSR
jgi:hypothetical protein